MLILSNYIHLIITDFTALVNKNSYIFIEIFTKTFLYSSYVQKQGNGHSALHDDVLSPAAGGGENMALPCVCPLSKNKSLILFFSRNFHGFSKRVLAWRLFCSIMERHEVSMLGGDFMKYILVIGDGMADNPLDCLGGKTPLEYASIPLIDELAAKGRVGSAQTIPAGQPAGSDTAFLTIFGCDPATYNKGRAPLEAAASGIVIAPGSAAYRCNMVALEDTDLPFSEKRILSHSGGDVEGDASIALVTALFADERFCQMATEAGLTMYPAPSFRHIAVQTGADLTKFNAFPPHDHLDEVIGPILPKGNATADALRGLMELAHEILDQHPVNIARRAAGKLPANGIWLWAEGVATQLPQFTETFGKSGGVISAVPLCHGIAALTGLVPISVEGATGKLHTNYEGKVEAAIWSLRENGDFVTIHVEAPDECTHNGDLEGKLQAIEWLDSRVMAHLLNGLKQAEITDYRILFMSDHKTLMATRGHDGEPVPFLLYDSRVTGNSGQTYCEADGARGEYLADGTKLLTMLFSDER